MVRRNLGQRKERDCQVMGSRSLALLPVSQGRGLHWPDLEGTNIWDTLRWQSPFAPSPKSGSFGMLSKYHQTTAGPDHTPSDRGIGAFFW